MANFDLVINIFRYATVTTTIVVKFCNSGLKKSLFGSTSAGISTLSYLPLLVNGAGIHVKSIIRLQ